MKKYDPGWFTPYPQIESDCIRGKKWSKRFRSVPRRPSMNSNMSHIITQSVPIATKWSISPHRAKKLRSYWGWKIFKSMKLRWPYEEFVRTKANHSDFLFKINKFASTKRSNLKRPSNKIVAGGFSDQTLPTSANQSKKWYLFSRWVELSMREHNGGQRVTR